MEHFLYSFIPFAFFYILKKIIVSKKRKRSVGVAVFLGIFFGVLVSVFYLNFLIALILLALMGAAVGGMGIPGYVIACIVGALVNGFAVSIHNDNIDSAMREASESFNKEIDTKEA